MGFIEVRLSRTGTDLNKVVLNFDGATRAGVRAVGRMLDKEVEARIQRIYNRPIPTRAQVKRFDKAGRPARAAGLSRALLAARGGAKAWKRTNALKDGRSLRFPSSFIAVVTVQGKSRSAITNWDNGYAELRHQLGVSWTPRKPALGVIRKNAFFAEAAEQADGKVGSTFADAWNRGIRR